MRNTCTFAFVTLAVWCHAATIHPTIPADAHRVRVPLEVTENRNTGYSGEDKSVSPSSMPEDIQQKLGARPLYWDFGQQLGSSYFAVGQVESAVKFLTTQRREVYQVSVYRRQGSDLEEITSGILSGDGNNFEVPIDLPVAPLGSNQLAKSRGVLSLRISDSNNRQSFSATGRLSLQVSGSTLLPQSKLTASLQNLTSTTVEKNQGITLRVEPFDTAIPARTINGKVGDVLDLSAAKVVVESIAENLSELTLAVVNGSLKEAETYKPALVSNLPALSQVELFTRKLVTSNDLLATAAKSSGILMIFGDLKEDAMPGYMGTSMKSASLQLGETLIMETVRSSVGSAPMPPVVFVVRQVNLKKLYEEYLGKEPPFLLLADHSDVLRVNFRNVREGGPGMYSYPGYSGQEQGQRGTLRDAMGLPEGRVAVVLLDKTGKVVYSKPDAGDDLRAPIIEAAQKAAEGTASH